MCRMLTLGMKETMPGRFQLIVLLRNPERIASVSCAREEIISETGERFWDIGYVTRVEGYEEEYDRNRNLTLRIRGRVVLEEDRIDNLKTYFDNRAKRAANFFQNESEIYAIAKVENIIRLSENLEKDTFRITAKLEGVPLIKTKDILNKDYRWKKYWQKIGEGLHLEETKQRYIELFNRSDKSLYIIMYRHRYANGFGQWIAGMHWL